MLHKFTWLRTGGVFQQFSKIADISCGRIAEYAVPKAALAPCFHVERKFLCHWRLFVPPAPKRSLLKDEYRNLVLPYIIDQVRPWCLAKIGNAAAQNYTWSHALDEISNGGILQFGQNTNFSPINAFDPFKLRSNYGNSDYDTRHYFSLNYGFTNITSVSVPASFSGTGGQTCTASAANPATPCLLASNFSPAVNGFGQQRRNQFTGPSYFNTDLAVTKNFKVPHWEGALLGVGGPVLQHPQSPAL